MIICLADNKIEIENRYPYVEEYCRDYLTYKESGLDFSIRIMPEDIAFERQKSEQEDVMEGREIRHFSDEYLETLAVYRRIAERMPCFDTVLFHGSCIAVDGEGYLFTAKSGIGKSTHTRLWRKLFGDRAVMVNDDKPLLRVNEEGSTIVYGTPWDGKHRLSSNIAVPLRAVCILERASDNVIREITKTEAYPMLLQQVYRPADPDAMRQTIFLLDRMDIQLYRLCCNMDISAAELSYRTMAGIDK